MLAWRYATAVAHGEVHSASCVSGPESANAPVHCLPYRGNLYCTSCREAGTPRHAVAAAQAARAKAQADHVYGYHTLFLTALGKHPAVGYYCTDG